MAKGVDFPIRSRHGKKKGRRRYHCKDISNREKNWAQKVAAREKSQRWKEVVAREATTKDVVSKEDAKKEKTTDAEGSAWSVDLETPTTS